MRGYEKPVFVENDELFEGVYADESGYSEEPSADVNATWTNHNSGSHSCISVNASVGPVKGNYMKITVTLPGSTRLITDLSGPYTNYEVNGNTVVIIREGAFNAGESFQFGINHAECDGTGEDDHDISEHQGSFFETGTHLGVSDGIGVSIEVS